MRSPGFWWKPRRGGRACLLSPLGFIYGQVTTHRMRQQGQKLDCPVICVGNWTAGGAGKTPVAPSASQAQHVRSFKRQRRNKRLPTPRDFVDGANRQR